MYCRSIAFLAWALLTTAATAQTPSEPTGARPNAVAVVGEMTPATKGEPGVLHLLERFQSGLGALLGLFVLSGVAYYNARQTRNRDAALRREDKAALAAELAAEIHQVRHELESEATMLSAAAKLAEAIGEDLDLTKHGSVRKHFPAFDANHGRLGLLDPGTVVRLVKFVRNIVYFPDLADVMTDDPSYMIEKWGEICMNAAKNADDLTKELAAIAGLDASELDKFPRYKGIFEDPSAFPEPSQDPQ